MTNKNVIKIDLEQTGFPVRIGEVEVWFNSSFENLRSFFKLEEIAERKVKEAQEKAEHIHFPDGIENYEASDYTEEDLKNVDAAIDLNKELVAVQYDIVFGDGTFKKIYEKHPDMVALERALEPTLLAVAERIEGVGEEYKENKKKLLND